MKRLFIVTFLIFAFILTFPTFSFAQGMMAENNDGHTAREETEGKEVWEKLQAKELSCEYLSDDDFGALGMYFMGLMAGESHEAMDEMMVQMMGEEGEEQMHIAMGKRMSNCEPNAPMPQKVMGAGMMPMMMNMMMGGGMMRSFGANPMGWFGGGFGLIFMILFWGFIILGIVVLIKWIMNQGKRKTRSKFLTAGRQGAFPPKADPPRAEDILKERYAKGEIDKKEYQEKKKDLS